MPATVSYRMMMLDARTVIFPARATAPRKTINGAYRSDGATGVGVVRLNGNLAAMKTPTALRPALTARGISAMATAQTDRTLSAGGSALSGALATL
jgi:hypothetical protein